MVKRNALLVLIVSLLAFTTVQAQQKATSESSLTPLDYYQIQQQISRASHGFDSAADNGSLYARAFTSDGVFVDAGGKAYEGREQLAEFARHDPGSKKGPTYVSQFAVSTMIDPSPTGALAKSYVMMTTQVSQLPGLVYFQGTVTDGGQFWDEFVKTPEGWRIKKRTFYRVGTPVSALAPLQSNRNGQGASVVNPAVLTQPAAGKEPVPVLTAEDYAQIEQLYARYGYGVDSGEDRGYFWANMFTPDGLHINASNRVEYVRGREALAAFVYGALQLGDVVSLDTRSPGKKSPMQISHHNTNVMIEPVPGGVNVKDYLMYVAIGSDGQPNQLYSGGIYFDFLVKTSEGWRFKHKNVLFLGVPLPPSLPDSFKSGTLASSHSSR
jgi:hypothetical protein